MSRQGCRGQTVVNTCLASFACRNSPSGYNTRTGRLQGCRGAESLRGETTSARSRANPFSNRRAHPLSPRRPSPSPKTNGLPCPPPIRTLLNGSQLSKDGKPRLSLVGLVYHSRICRLHQTWASLFLSFCERCVKRCMRKMSLKPLAASSTHIAATRKQRSRCASGSQAVRIHLSSANRPFRSSC